jgi:probable addiction module antidote protein
MNTIFIGGSRHISRLSAEAKERLQNVVSSGAHVVVGDANGADKAVQKFLQDASYHNVTVYCSGDLCRNNLGRWETHNVPAPKNAKGFDFYAIKDREMANEADFGLMIWDGKSPGTVLNILRLVRAGKKAVLLNQPDHETKTFKSSADWTLFVSHLNEEFRGDLRKRATPEEWALPMTQQQASFLDEQGQFAEAASPSTIATEIGDQVAEELNAALAKGDAASAIDALGNAARARGMSQVAKETGLARESLYRSLASGGNPEFNTVLRVLAAMGLRLAVKKASDDARDDRP